MWGYQSTPWALHCLFSLYIDNEEEQKRTEIRSLSTRALTAALKEGKTKVFSLRFLFISIFPDGHNANLAENARMQPLPLPATLGKKKKKKRSWPLIEGNEAQLQCFSRHQLLWGNGALNPEPSSGNEGGKCLVLAWHLDLTVVRSKTHQLRWPRKADV